MLRMLIWLIVIVILAGMAYVRLAPSDPAQWHMRAEPAGTGTQTRSNGYIWRKIIDGEDDGRAMLQALADAAEATPRTALLAGSVQGEKLTYVTRSAFFGFPDYTTMGIYATAQGERYVEVYGRARFGTSDLGVNTKRIRGWLAAAQI